MTKRCRLIVGCVLVLGGLLCSCGDSQESSAPYDHTLGDVKEGAPLVTGVTDPGILKDPTSYQPTTPPSGEPASMGGESAAAGSSGGGGAGDEVKTAAEELLGDLRDGEIQLALEYFNPEHVQVLLDGDRYDPMFTTFELIDAVAQRVDAAKVNELLGGLRGLGSAELKWELADNDHASVTPNITMLLFGPVRAADAMVLVRGENGWRFQLDTPLTAEDVDAIVTFHQNLQTALNQIITWLDASATVDEAQLKTAIAQALSGQPIDLTGGTGAATETPEETPAETPEETPEPNEAP